MSQGFAREPLLYRSVLPLLNELRARFSGDLLDPDAPWEGSLDEWMGHFAGKLGIDLREEGMEEGTRWVRQKYGAAKAKAHREFLRVVRKDPAAHRRKMRMDKKYHERHKWHDRVMRRTRRAGWRREGLDERDPGQAFADLPFELRVTSGGETEARGALDSGQSLTPRAREKAARAASKKTGVDVPQHYQKACSMDAFYKNTQYFYRVKGQEWEGSKQKKLQRAIAASYSVLKRSCGVTSTKSLTPSEIVRQGGGKLGVRGRTEEARETLREATTGGEVVGRVGRYSLVRLAPRRTPRARGVDRDRWEVRYPTRAGTEARIATIVASADGEDYDVQVGTLRPETIPRSFTSVEQAFQAAIQRWGKYHAKG